MKRILLIIFLLLFWVPIAQAGNLITARGGVGPEPGPIAVWYETFDGSLPCGDGANSNCDNTWNRMDGNPAYNVDQCAGVNSMASGVSQTTEDQLPLDYDEIYYSFCVHIDSYSTIDGVTEYYLYTKNTTGTSIGGMRMDKTSNSTASFKAFVQGGSRGPGVPISLNTTYKVLVRVKRNSGAGDAEAEIWVTTDGDFSGPGDEFVNDGLTANQIRHLTIFTLGYEGMAQWTDCIGIYETKPDFWSCSF